MDYSVVTGWRAFLQELSVVIIESDEFDLPGDVIEAGWLGFEPAPENLLAATELRLGARLPPSLRSFYEVSNGWRQFGCFIWELLPLERLNWLREAEPWLFEDALKVESHPGPFKKDPDGKRLAEFRFEDGTRVERSLVVTSMGDDALWMLDPGTVTGSGEWAGGRWANWDPGMNWCAESFADLVRDEFAFFKTRANSGTGPPQR